MVVGIMYWTVSMPVVGQSDGTVQNPTAGMPNSYPVNDKDTAFFYGMIGQPSNEKCVNKTYEQVSHLQGAKLGHISCKRVHIPPGQPAVREHFVPSLPP